MTIAIWKGAFNSLTGISMSFAADGKGFLFWACHEGHLYHFFHRGAEAVPPLLLHHGQNCSEINRKSIVTRKLMTFQYL